MTIDLLGRYFGVYKLVELLGRGGMASVYRGYQESIDRSVAIKVLPSEFLHDPSFSQRFLQEARALSKLTHPAIVSLYEFGQQDDLPYIVMPLMSGGSLADRLKRGALPLDEVARILTPLADALDFAHRQNVWHRDVKPNNILFDQHNNPYLSDFGIAKAVGSAASSLTGSGIIGTPDYMSPEQARGEQIDHRADIYSLGVVAYQMLTGEVMFKATTPLGVIYKHINELPPPLRQLRPELPASVEDIVFKSLAKNPGDRYGSANEFIRALTDVIRSPSTKVMPPPTVSDLNAPTQIESIRRVPSTVAVPPKASEPKKSNTALWVAFSIIGGIIVMCAVASVLVFGVGIYSASATAQAETTNTAIARANQTSAARVNATSTSQAEKTAVARASALTATSSARIEATTSSLARVSASWTAVLVDSFTAATSQWPVGNYNAADVTANHSIVGGKYRWTLKPTKSVSWRAGPNAAALTDFRLSVEGKRISGPAVSTYGLYFRRDGDDMYVFQVNDQREYSAAVYTKGAWVTLIDRTFSSLIQANNSNRLTVVAQGSLFLFYINNQFVDDMSDTRLSKGTVGMVCGMSSSTDEVVIDFDNFEVRAP